jgi:hypothetical protein
MKKFLKSYLIRPIIYKTVTKLLVAVVIGGVWDRFCNTRGYLSAALTVASIFAVIFAVMAWFTFLRLDGVHIPRLKLPKSKKKQRMQTLSDLTDHLDTELVPFEELAEDERDFCSLVSSLLCFLICLIVSVVSWIF